MAQMRGGVAGTQVLRGRPTMVEEAPPSMQHPLETMSDGEPMRLSQSATLTLVRTCLLLQLFVLLIPPSIACH